MFALQELASANVTLLEFAVYGVIVHTAKTRYLFFFPSEWPRGPDFVCTVVYQVVRSLVMQRGEGLQELHWQADNCYRFVICCCSAPLALHFLCRAVRTRM